MEERLDDAINVLRNHAESQALSLAAVQHSASGIVPLYHQHLVSYTNLKKVPSFIDT